MCTRRIVDARAIRPRPVMMTMTSTVLGGVPPQARQHERHPTEDGHVIT
jgi:multidrug efflux pump subunit AcrB